MNAHVPAWKTLGEQIVKFYYSTFESNREQLVQLYSPDALFTFEEHMGQGHAAIKEILTVKLQFGVIKHIATTIDCQPSSDNGVVVHVTGRLQVRN